MKKFIIAGLMTLSLVGCANNQGSNPITGMDRYSGSKTVLIQPHATDCKSAQCIAIGAFWSSDENDMALLSVSIMNTADFIIDAYIEIDGVRYQLQDNGDLTQYKHPYSNMPGVTNSQKDYVIPLQVIKKLSMSKRAWVFVKTSGGYKSDAIIDGQGDSKAYYAMQRFIAALPK